jgi:hypothetical protein
VFEPCSFGAFEQPVITIVSIEGVLSPGESKVFSIPWYCLQASAQHPTCVRLTPFMSFGPDEDFMDQYHRELCSGNTPNRDIPRGDTLEFLRNCPVYDLGTNTCQDAQADLLNLGGIEMLMPDKSRNLPYVVDLKERRSKGESNRK